MKLILTFFLVFLLNTIYAQRIDNVRSEQSAKTIIVTYDLSELKRGQTATISLYCSEDGGNTWSSALLNVIGDVGKNISSGTNKKIIWNVLFERERLTGEVKFKVIAEGSADFSLGLKYGGGIIFYVDMTGQHGLIAATKDQSKGIQWGCNGSPIVTSSSGIGTGQANTKDIVNRCSQISAARLCDNLDLNGFNDWFLPSKEELNLMYQQKKNIGGFGDGLYWSSTAVNSSFAWLQAFSNGRKDTSYKSADFNVRAVRAF
jgi:hypothetical protein